MKIKPHHIALLSMIVGLITYIILWNEPPIPRFIVPIITGILTLMIYDYIDKKRKF